MRRPRAPVGALLVLIATSGCAHAHVPSPEPRFVQSVTPSVTRSQTPSMTRSEPVPAPAIEGEVLWYLPGLVSGAVTLVADPAPAALPAASSGGGSTTPDLVHPGVLALERGTKLVVRPPVVRRAGSFEVRLVGDDGWTMASVGGNLKPGQSPGEPLEFVLPPGAEQGGTRAELQLYLNGMLRDRAPCLLL